MGRHWIHVAGGALLFVSAASAADKPSSPSTRIWLEITRIAPNADVVTKTVTSDAPTRFRPLIGWECSSEASMQGPFVAGALRCDTAEGYSVMVAVSCNPSRRGQHEQSQVVLTTPADGHRAITLHCANP